jgi:hypothetical protein
MKAVALLSCVLFVAAAGAVGVGGERVKIAVTPAYSFAPSYMRVRVRLEPNADNRVLAIIAESEGFYRRSEVQLDGDEAPASIEMAFPDVPGGEYEIKAVLIDNRGKECAVSHVPATVISRRAEP